MAEARQKDSFGIVTDEQWDELHADLREMAAQRRRVEAESAFIVIGSGERAEGSHD